jgi:acetyl esterase/lipase
MYSTDWEKQQNDDQVFPGRTTDEILKKYPPTVIWTAEWDFLRRDCEVFAERLKKHGKLAEFSMMPGRAHGFQQFGNSQETTWFEEEEKLAFDHLVAK